MLLHFKPRSSSARLIYAFAVVSVSSASPTMANIDESTQVAMHCPHCGARLIWGERRTALDDLYEFIFPKTLPARFMVWFSYPAAIISTLVSLMGTEMLSIPQAVFDACPGVITSIIRQIANLFPLGYVAIRWEHEARFREKVKGYFRGSR